MTKIQTRKLVFNEDQLNELASTPALATAIILAYRDDHSLTTKELFLLARASIRQLDMFNQAVDNGEIVVPKTLADAESNGIAMSHLAQPRLEAQAQLAKARKAAVSH